MKIAGGGKKRKSVVGQRAKRAGKKQGFKKTRRFE